MSSSCMYAVPMKYRGTLYSTNRKGPFNAEFSVPYNSRIDKFTINSVILQVVQ